MILHRLQVREKLSLLVVVPLAVVALLVVPLLAGRIDVARASTATASTATLTRDASGYVEGLQRVRLLSVAYLSGRDVAANELVVALQDSEVDRVQLLAQATDGGKGALGEALTAAASTAALGDWVVTRAVTAPEVVEALAGTVDAVVDALELGARTDVEAGAVASLDALDALLRANEAAARAGCLLLLAAAGVPAQRPGLVTDARDLAARADALGEQFARLAGREPAQVYGQAVTGPSRARIVEATDLLSRAGTGSVAAAVDVYAAVQSQNSVRQLVQTRVAQDLTVRSAAQARAATFAVAGLGAAGTLAFGLVIALTVVVGRSVSRPLRRLTAAAGRVADLAQEELLRVADEDVETSGGIRLAAVEATSEDEIGELAEAFNRVQATAALLLERQVVSRRNVATMFAGVGRRTSNLVGRQLGLIERLERTESDPDVLATLYRLDHVSTRLRRNASSLVVLSGGTESGGDGRPVPIGDAIRAALGSIEEYQRVTIGRLPAVLLAPGAATDLVLMLAELMENAVLFSPPRSAVEVEGERTPDGGCRLTVADHGLGMSVERFAEENARLRRRERLDLAPTDVLGLFVVGRIARRHGADVQLEPTTDHGVTAVVRLPAGLLVDPDAAPAASRPRRERRPEAEAVRTPDLVRAEVVPAAAVVGGVVEAAPVEAPRGETALAEPATVPEPDPVIVAAPPAGAPVDLPAPSVGADPAGVQPPVPADVPPGVPRRVPGSHFVVPAVSVEPVAVPVTTAPATVDADSARRELDDVDAAVRRAATEARQGSRPARHVPPSLQVPVAPAAPAAPGAEGIPGVRRRVPGRALEAFDTTSALVGRPSVVDAEEVRAALDGVGEAVHQALLHEPERTVRTRRHEAEAVERADRERVAAEQAAAQKAQAEQAEAERANTAADVDEGGPAVIVRRRPGAALAALEDADPATAAAPARRDAAVADRSERPEDVLAWADDLETAITQVDDLLGRDTATTEHPAEHPAADAEETR